jgi:protein kinase A
LYENILAGKVRYPSYFDPQAKDLLSKLLIADLSQRFGNLSNGSKDIMSHPWFSEVSWDRLAKREIDSPYQPPLRGSGDASLFDKYAEDAEEYGDFTSEDAFGNLFPDF